MPVGSRCPSLHAFLGALPLDQAERLRGGGTPARARRFELDGRSWVVKYLPAGQALVDGHDSLTLALKIDQIALIRAECPALAPHYVEVVADYRGPDGCAFVMPYFPGENAMALLRCGPEAFAAWYGDVVANLVRNGYATQRTSAPPDTLARLYIDRVHRRLPVLEQWLPSQALADELAVNGEYCRSPLALIDAIERDIVLLDSLAPPSLFMPVHGDLNLGNIRVADRDSWVVVDPRGTLEPWDVIYDLAKGILSLVVFEHALESGFRISLDDGAVPRWAVSLLTPAGAAATRASDTVALHLTRIPELQELLADDDGWNRRLVFGVALHALADAACRISDVKEREGRDSARARAEVALGLWLVGTLLLERLVAAHEYDAAPSALPSLAWASN
jgi:hypothetical protein